MLLNATHFRLDNGRQRIEEERRFQEAQREARQKEINSFSEAVAQVDGGFPVDAIINFLRQYGSIADFESIRDLSTLLQVPWTEFEGNAVVGGVNEPNAGGFHTEGDTEYDFDDLVHAIDNVPRISYLNLREFHPRQRDPFIVGFSSLGLTQEDMSRRNSTIACFGRFDEVAPTLPFANLQVLLLEGNVRMQQFTFSSVLLREVEIRRNRLVTFAGFIDLPCLRKIRLDRCPRLKKAIVQGSTKSALKTLHIVACQVLDVDTIKKIIEESAPMDEFVWSDMFWRNSFSQPVGFPKHVDFLKSSSMHTKSLTVDRFSLCLPRDTKLEPMKTIFDHALFGLLSNPTARSVSIRGSSVISALPLVVNSPVQMVDVSSCKALQEIGLYELDSLQNRATTKLESLVVDDCPKLVTPVLEHSYFDSLKHLSCQGCLLVTNDILQRLPSSLEHLDLTGCTSIGDFVGLSWCCAPTANLRWCSFKQTSVTATDVQEWMSIAISLEYLNLGNLTLENLCLSSASLKVLLLLNVDMSNAFDIVCPRLEQLWIGTRYNGWPYMWSDWNKHKAMSPAVHGESLVSCLLSITSDVPGTIQVYLPHDFKISFTGTKFLQCKLKDVCEVQPARQPSFGGPIGAYDKWSEAKVKQVCQDTKEFLVSESEGLNPCVFNVVIAKGPRPGYESPYLEPKAPDAKWHRDYSKVGFGHDGGYSDQCESNWYSPPANDSWQVW